MKRRGADRRILDATAGGGAVEMERVEQKDQKVGKREDGSEPVIGARDLDAPRPSTPLVAAPSTLPDLPDLFVGPLVSLRAAPFNPVESSY
jgi:hypothetical protein